MINKLFRKIDVKFAVYFCFVASTIILFLSLLEFMEVIPYGIIWTGKEVVKSTYNSTPFLRVRELQSLFFLVNIVLFPISIRNIRLLDVSERPNDKNAYLVYFAIISLAISMIIADYIDMELLNNIYSLSHLIILLLYPFCMYRILLDYAHEKN